MAYEHSTGVITSINPPSDAVRAFAAVDGLDGLIVIGDRKTPTDWHCEGVDFWSLERQIDTFGAAAEALPVNHYCRKNLGYVIAARNSTHIYDTDDDNLPRPNWRLPIGQGAMRVTEPGQGFVNVYKHFTDDPIWPRGYPIDALERPLVLAEDGADVPPVPVWQGLADDDPDVDAIYRMVIGKTGIAFADTAPLVLSKGSYSPFNSQNTVFFEEAFALLYLPVTVTMRYTDILRGYVAVAVLEAQGKHIGFSSPLVYQERNVHDLMRDFTDEVPMYLTCKPVMEALVDECARISGSTEDLILACYKRLLAMEVVSAEEIDTLTAWLLAMETARGAA